MSILHKFGTLLPMLLLGSCSDDASTGQQPATGGVGSSMSGGTGGAGASMSGGTGGTGGNKYGGESSRRPPRGTVCRV